MTLYIIDLAYQSHPQGAPDLEDIPEMDGRIYEILNSDSSAAGCGFGFRDIQWDRLTAPPTSDELKALTSLPGMSYVTVTEVPDDYYDQQEQILKAFVDGLLSQDECDKLMGQTYATHKPVFQWDDGTKGSTSQ
jgi:hypothetical protein